MLKDNLTAIKGELFNYFAIMHIDMVSKINGTIDFEELGDNVERNMKDIFSINTVDDLDRFCDDYGLNNTENDDEATLSFYNLAKKYC